MTRVENNPPAALQPTQDLNVAATTSLVSPRELKARLPMTAQANRLVVESRRIVRAILDGADDRMLVLAGPCSIHDVAAALEYAGRLAQLKHELDDRLYIIMRVYFEKPRTTIGWKGLINDPHLDGSFDMADGLRLARQLLLDITGMGLAAGTEMLEPITPQYIADLVTWASIGARTIESQTHRQMASGLSMPVGYKNSTDGNLLIAVEAMKAARSGHHFLGIDEDGRTAIVQTRGNPAGHVILRGGRGRPNYDPDNVADAARQLADAGLPPVLMVDCSHANSGKKHEGQEVVWKSIIEQCAEHGRGAGDKHAGSAANPPLRRPIIGAMLESNLLEGAQPHCDDRTRLRYGVSITDACIGWEKTEQLLRQAHQQLS